MLSMLLSMAAFAQNSEKFYINVTAEDNKPTSNSYFIEEVIDARSSQEQIGVVILNEKQIEADLPGGLQAHLQKYVNDALPNTENLPSYILKVEELFIQENRSFNLNSAYAETTVSFYQKNGEYIEKIYKTRASTLQEGENLSALHGQNIKKILNECLDNFTKHLDQGEIIENTESAAKNQVAQETISEPNTTQQKTQTTTNYPKFRNRNILAVGFGIGGLTIIGFNYELRVHDYIGIHAGMGYVGYTAGIKIHTKPLRDSHFINLSFKDASFGHAGMVAAEFGGRWVFKKGTRFGLHYQAGLGYYTNISDEMLELAFNNEEPPNLTVSFGIGFSW